MAFVSIRAFKFSRIKDVIHFEMKNSNSHSPLTIIIDNNRLDF